MNEQQFWSQLQQLIYDSDEPQERQQGLIERLVQFHSSPPLPTKLIIETVCNGSVYLNERSHLNFPSFTPNPSLSANQQLALEMTLSNSAIALIAGSPATGKTPIATSLADVAINTNKRVLILTHHNAALTAYCNLPGYPFWCGHQDYRNWIIEQLRSQLAQPQMDYLPLHLLPDGELAKLRTPARLETWLPIIRTSSQQQLTELLIPAFPDLEIPRVQLLAYRLQQLEPLLQQQLKLSQLYANLSEPAIRELANQLSQNPQVPILGTVAEFMESQHQALWQTTFDLVIVEEAQYLTWLELMLLSTLGHKLVLFGNAMSSNYYKSLQNNSFFTSFPHCFNWLNQNLLPSYYCQLTEQFRLHPEIAKFVYPVISNSWIQTQRTPIGSQLPQLKHRLVWQDVPTNKVGEEILRFIQSFEPQLSSQIGIITFDVQQRDWFLANFPREFSKLLIATVTEWVGIEREIVIVSCGGHPENINSQDINIALTRGQEYLILFGDYDLWRQLGSPLRSFLYQPIHKERTVILS